MRGRPRLDDSRTNQYRVRLNDEESYKLDYASASTGKPKSEIFRLALVDYYNKVLMNEACDKAKKFQDIGGIDLKRALRCPHCTELIVIDLEDKCTVTASEKQMGPETLYEFDFEERCPICCNRFRICGYVSEYPVGAFNHEEVKTMPVQEEE